MMEFLIFILFMAALFGWLEANHYKGLSNGYKKQAEENFKAAMQERARTARAHETLNKIKGIASCKD